MTAKQIAEMNAVSPATVNNKLREYGISKQGREGGSPTAREAEAEPEETLETEEAEWDEGVESTTPSIWGGEVEKE